MANTQVMESWPVKKTERWQQDQVGCYFKLKRMPNQVPLVPQTVSTS